MAETTDQIRLDADYARHRLAEDLNRLESRVERLSDWQLWFRRYPWQVLGGAFAGAFALALMMVPGATQRKRARMRPVMLVPVERGASLPKYLSDSCIV